MLAFAREYGEWNDFFCDYKWQKLGTAAAYYGYHFRAHDSLEDVRATLYIFAESVQKRLKFLCSTSDGFAVAQFDLETRGPGDFFGSRQHGLPTLQIADLMNDTRTLHAAQAEAAALLAAEDTSLAANITVTEMFMATQKLVAYYYEPMALYIEVGVIYLIFSTVLTWVQRWGEKKLSAYGAQKE